MWGVFFGFVIMRHAHSHRRQRNQPYARVARSFLFAHDGCRRTERVHGPDGKRIRLRRIVRQQRYRDSRERREICRVDASHQKPARPDTGDMSGIRAHCPCVRRPVGQACRQGYGAYAGYLCRRILSGDRGRGYVRRPPLGRDRSRRSADTACILGHGYRGGPSQGQADSRIAIPSGDDGGWFPGSADCRLYSTEQIYTKAP